MTRTVRRLLIAACISGAGFGSTILWYKLTEASDSGIKKQKQIARLVTASNDVQRKQVHKLIWQPVLENEILYVGEAIRTASNAEARIEFLQGGTAIDLEPDSAIVLEEQDGKVALDFLKGNIFVKAGASGDATDIALKTGDKTVDLGNTELSLGKTRSGQIDLQVVKGQLQGTDLAKLASSQIKILSPLPGQPVYLNPEQRESTLFQWEPLPAGYTVTLEAGEARGELKPVAGATGAGDKGELATPFKIGKSYFRLIGRSSDPQLPELRSPVLRVQVLAKIPPVLLQPAQKSTLTVGKADPDVQFLWSNPAGFAKVIVEIASSADLKQKVATQYLDNVTEYTHAFEKTGIYYWRVSGVLEGKKEVVSSKVQAFRLTVLNELAPPELESPLSNDKIPVEQIKDKGLFLSWKMSHGADRYRVTVERAGASNREPSSTEKIYEEELKLLQTNIGSLDPGQYTWTVSAVGPNNQVSKPAERRTFTVQTLPVLPWADEKEQEDYYYITLKPSVQLRWQKGSHAKWRARIWNEDSPLEVLSETVDRDVLEMALPSDGRYVAEVEGLDAKGNVVARTKRRMVRVVPAPLLPAPEFASDIGREIEATASGAAKLAWQPVNGAGSYVMSVQGPNGEVKEYKFANLSGTVRDLMPGQYKVTLRSVDQNGRTGPGGEERVIKVPNLSNVKAPKLKGVKVK